MPELLIPPDKQPVPKLMTQLAAVEVSYTAKSTSKGGTEATVTEFAIVSNTRLGKTSDSRGKCTTATSHFSQVQQVFPVSQLCTKH